MNYQEAMKQLIANEEQLSKKSFDIKFWKPSEGQYKILATSEIEDSRPFEEQGKEPQLRKQLNIVVDDVEYIWTFPFGFTKVSTYGQLVKLGEHHGKLKGIEFTCVVQGKGKNRRITIVL